MQRIERYGVIALVFLLVTIVAVSLWGEQDKAGGLFPFLKRESKSAQVGRLVAEPPRQPVPPAQPARTSSIAERMLPLADPPADLPVPRAQTPPGPLVAADPLADPLLREPLVSPEPVPESIVMPARVDPPPDEPPTAPRERTAPTERAERTYAVRAGDTLSEIASRELGTVRRLQELLDANPGVDPLKLRVGQEIRLPATSSAGATLADASGAARAESVPAPRPSLAERASRRYTIQKGDTLSQIASRELGSVERMDDILALNPELERDHLVSGRTLLLPAGRPVPGNTRLAVATPPEREAAASGSRPRSKVR